MAIGEAYFSGGYLVCADKAQVLIEIDRLVDGLTEGQSVLIDVRPAFSGIDIGYEYKSKLT